MRILEVIPISKNNPFPSLLLKHLRQSSEVKAVNAGIHYFWEKSVNADIVHFHWPEALVGWRPCNSHELSRLGKTLEWWKARARLVATVHNRKPHYWNADVAQRLYERVYAHMDGVIHCGQTSLDEFKVQFPDCAMLPQVVIPQGLHTGFPNLVTQTEARKRLKLPESTAVFLAFGHMRHIEEGEQILKGFSALPMRNKQLLIVTNRAPRKHLLRRLLFRVRTRCDPKIRFQIGIVPEQDVQYVVNAADVLVISRLEILNSGNLQLGFTFGKVVVGPDRGVVGEILRQTGNPVFSPGNIQSVSQALAKGYALSQTNQGQDNLCYGKTKLDWKRLSEHHVDFFKSLLCTGRTIERGQRLRSGKLSSVALKPGSNKNLPRYNYVRL